MDEIDNIASKLPIDQKQFFFKICEKDFEDMPLKYYLMEITNNDFLSFVENSEYSVFHLQQILIGIIKEDPSNIVKLVDLLLVLSSLKQKHSCKVEMDTKSSIHNFENESKIEEPKFIPNPEIETESKFIHTPVNHLNKEVYELKEPVHMKDHLNIQEVAEFTKISVDIIKDKLFDQALLYPFNINKKEYQKTFKKVDVIQWFNSNKYELIQLM